MTVEDIANSKTSASSIDKILEGDEHEDEQKKLNKDTIASLTGMAAPDAVEDKKDEKVKEEPKKEDKPKEEPKKEVKKDAAATSAKPAKTATKAGSKGSSKKETKDQTNIGVKVDDPPEVYSLSSNS